MFPRLFEIDTSFAIQNFMELLLISLAVSVLFYYLIGFERKKFMPKGSNKPARKPQFMFYLYNFIFYCAILLLAYTLLSKIVGVSPKPSGIAEQGHKSLDLNTYGFLLAIAFTVGIFMVIRKAKNLGIPIEKYLDLSIWMILSSLFGARLFYMLFEYRYTIEQTADKVKETLSPPIAFFSNPLAYFTDIFSGGLVAYGGMIVATLVSLFLIKRYGLSYGKTFDIYAPSIAIGDGFARLGCNFAGCCFGNCTSPDNPLSLNWKELFQENVAPVYKHYSELLTRIPDATIHSDFLYVWPAQLMSSVSGFISFGLISWFYVKRKKLNWSLMVMWGVLLAMLVLILWSKSFESTLWLEKYKEFPTVKGNPDTIIISEWVLGIAPMMLVGNIFMLMLCFYNLFLIITKKLNFDGIVLVLFGLYYSCARFIIESVRDDTEKIINPFSAAQIIGFCIIFLCTGFIFYFSFFKKKKAS